MCPTAGLSVAGKWSGKDKSMLGWPAFRSRNSSPGDTIAGVPNPGPGTDTGS